MRIIHLCDVFRCLDFQFSKNSSFVFICYIFVSAECSEVSELLKKDFIHVQSCVWVRCIYIYSLETKNISEHIFAVQVYRLWHCYCQIFYEVSKLVLESSLPYHINEVPSLVNYSLLEIDLYVLESCSYWRDIHVRELSGLVITLY